MSRVDAPAVPPRPQVIDGSAAFEALPKRYLHRLRDAAKLAVYVPTGVYGLRKFLGFPDLDVRLLGIGAHRHFLFHSAISLYAFKWAYERYCRTTLGGDGLLQRVGRKTLAVGLAGSAVGVGIHLLVDVFQPRAVLFPFIGSLMNGTLAEDRLWLLGNSLWAFKTAHDLLFRELGPDYRRALGWVRRTVVDPLLLDPSEAR